MSAWKNKSRLLWKFCICEQVFPLNILDFIQNLGCLTHLQVTSFYLNESQHFTNSHSHILALHVWDFTFNNKYQTAKAVAKLSHLS